MSLDQEQVSSTEGWQSAASMAGGWYVALATSELRHGLWSSDPWWRLITIAGMMAFVGFWMCGHRRGR